jgi:acetate kinase
MILTLNAGSSSIRFALFTPAADEPVQTVAGKIEGIGTAPHLIARDADGTVVSERRWDDGAAMAHEAFLADLLDWVDHHLDREGLRAVGHRVVHGGADLIEPARITPSLLRAIEALCPLAPLHQPHNIAAIKAVAAARPELAQVACFDTAFHHTQSAVATRFAIPRRLEEEGVRRYGFHGLSYEYVARRLVAIDPAAAQGRVIVAHLGNGASLCALAGGKSVDTTMSFTALDGLVMGTRCGTIDPGVLLYLAQKGMSVDAIEHLLYEQSGLLGVSGVSSDMRVLLDSDDPRAEAAIDLFAYRAARESGALVASLGGLDTFVFTAGIGENAPAIRARIGARLEWLGLRIDAEANEAGRPVISAPDSRIVVRVLPTDEERMIAVHTTAIVAEANS